MEREGLPSRPTTDPKITIWVDILILRVRDLEYQTAVIKFPMDEILSVSIEKSDSYHAKVKSLSCCFEKVKPHEEQQMH